MVVEQTQVKSWQLGDFCQKCFKDSPKDHWVDGAQIWLCGGCGYDLRTWTNFLRSNGVGIVKLKMLERQLDRTVESQGEGEKGVSRGKRTSVKDAAVVEGPEEALGAV